MRRRTGGCCRVGAGVIDGSQHDRAAEHAGAQPLSSPNGEQEQGPESWPSQALAEQQTQPLVGRGLPRSQASVQHEAWMRRALEVASSTPLGDVPVGAVVLGPDGRELAVGVNTREKDRDPLGHAEIAAIRAATARLGDAWRLEDCTLVVTLEPCAMCAGAALGARIGKIVYGASEPRTGACGSVWDLPRETPLHKAEVYGGVLKDECEALIREFFEKLR